MFRIKICGITTVDDALIARDAGADAIGLNFYPQSPRYIHPEQAQRIAAALGNSLHLVGVFVNVPVSEVQRLADSLPLHFVQLHGDEPAEHIGELAPRPVIRAFRLRDADLSPIADYMERCRQLATLPSSILVDAFQPGIFGGTGKTVDWGTMADLAFMERDLHTILAGGLRPDNVEQAIAVARPDAVDVAGGVERSPGRKDPLKVRLFVDAALRGFNLANPGKPL